MDAIEKIKLKGIEYGVGGSKVKLVARGTYTNNVSTFILNNRLEMNKFYYVVIICGDWDYKFSSIIFTDNFINTPFSSITLIDDNDSNVIPAFISYTENTLDNENIYGISVVSGEYGNLFQGVTQEELNTCEVYELPFTLGGNE